MSDPTGNALAANAAADDDLLDLGRQLHLAIKAMPWSEWPLRLELHDHKRRLVGLDASGVEKFALILRRGFI